MNPIQLNYQDLSWRLEKFQELTLCLLLSVGAARKMTMPCSCLTISLSKHDFNSETGHLSSFLLFSFKTFGVEFAISSAKSAGEKDDPAIL